MPRLIEAIIVGGGPAGAAAAIRLARAGREVLLLERSRTQADKVCGAFLSEEALAALARLGLPAQSLGAVPIDRVRLSAASLGAEAALPFAAAGLDRATLDPALLAAAERAGAVVRRGAIVRAVAGEGASARVELAGGATLRARYVLPATGKQDLPGTRRTTGWRGRGGMIGLRMPLALPEAAARRLGAAIELHLFRGGCAGLQPVDGGANLCITLGDAAYRRAGMDFAALLALIARENDAFAAAIADARPLRARPLAIARVPYGFQRTAAPPDGPIFHLGDQMAVTASFTGGGLSIALESGIAAAEAILAGRTAQDYARAFAHRTRRQVRAAMALQALVDRPALHAPALRVARRLPGLVRLLARATRMPPARGPADDRNPVGDGSFNPPVGRREARP